jgi:hypothetical protein
LTGNQLKALRSRSGLGAAKFGAELGYGGKSHTIARTVRRLEGLKDEAVSESIAFLAWCFERKLERAEAKWRDEADALLAKNSLDVAFGRRFR